LRLVVIVAEAADDDAVLRDLHLDGAMSGPVLGVDGVVLDGRIQPQPVALLAVIEGPLQRPGAACGPPAAYSTQAAARSSATAAASARGRYGGLLFLLSRALLHLRTRSPGLDFCRLQLR